MAALFVRDVELDGGVCFTGAAEAPSVYLDHRRGHPPAQALINGKNASFWLHKLHPFIPYTSRALLQDSTYLQLIM